MDQRGQMIPQGQQRRIDELKTLINRLKIPSEEGTKFPTLYLS